MSKRSDLLLIQDITESVDKILRYTAGFDKLQFESDDRTIDAVVRNIEIIGEAANHLSEDFKDRYNQVDWFKIRGLRNRIVHHYFGIDIGIIWHLVQENIPDLKAKLEVIETDWHR